MTWDEVVNQHISMYTAKEANVPRNMISVGTYDDFPRHSKLIVQQHFCPFDKNLSSRQLEAG